MINRTLNPLQTQSFFIFGPRGCGKSTLVRNLGLSDVAAINLLEPDNYEEATLRLSDFAARLQAAVDSGTWVFIDEVQKAPRVLDVVQQLIDERAARFVLTGSSARKLKRGGGNLLAGRAFTYHLHPFTAQELGTGFDLETHLAYGGLPSVWNLSTARERETYLRGYIATYLKEEIAEEQLVRALEPFGRFLQVAAQASGKILNFSAIGKDVGISDQTAKTYFQILEDTLLGFLLPPYHHSVRKTQGRSPKFYLFDTGVIRALRRQVSQPLTDQNYGYGDLFEHFVIQEIRRRAEYFERDFDYFFLRTADDQEIDLIIDRPGRSPAVIEIKSATSIRESDLSTLLRVGGDVEEHAELYCLSRDPQRKHYGRARALHWDEGITEIVG